MSMIEIGEYDIPDGCRAMVAEGKVHVIERKDRRLKPGEYRCRDCRFFAKGLCTPCQPNESDLCLKKPKNVKYRKTWEQLYYGAQKYGRPCADFEKREGNK